MHTQTPTRSGVVDCSPGRYEYATALLEPAAELARVAAAGVLRGAGR